MTSTYSREGCNEAVTEKLSELLEAYDEKRHELLQQAPPPQLMSDPDSCPLQSSHSQGENFRNLPGNLFYLLNIAYRHFSRSLGLITNFMPRA